MNKRRSHRSRPPTRAVVFDFYFQKFRPAILAALDRRFEVDARGDVTVFGLMEDVVATRAKICITPRVLAAARCRNVSWPGAHEAAKIISTSPPRAACYWGAFFIPERDGGYESLWTVLIDHADRADVDPMEIARHAALGCLESRDLLMILAQ
jgi:hypothetical protein